MNSQFSLCTNDDDDDFSIYFILSLLFIFFSQSSQATFHEQHFESALDFGEDIFMPGEGEDVDEEFNGISHLFDDWNESESRLYNNCQVSYYFMNEFFYPL